MLRRSIANFQEDDVLYNLRLCRHEVLFVWGSRIAGAPLPMPAYIRRPLKITLCMKCGTAAICPMRKNRISSTKMPCIFALRAGRLIPTHSRLRREFCCKGGASMQIHLGQIVVMKKKSIPAEATVENCSRGHPDVKLVCQTCQRTIYAGSR